MRLCVGQLSVYCDLKAKREPYSAGTFSVVPKGMDCAMPILDVKFHHKGDEAKAITTLYALVQGTKNVWRAVGRRLKNGTLWFDPEDDLEKHKGWSIILVAAREFNFPA